MDDKQKNELRELLTAFSIFDDRIGYVQGMNFIAN